MTMTTIRTIPKIVNTLILHSFFVSAHCLQTAPIYAKCRRTGRHSYIQ